jgi:hypothetical protein
VVGGTIEWKVKISAHLADVTVSPSATEASPRDNMHRYTQGLSALEGLAHLSVVTLILSIESLSAPRIRTHYVLSPEEKASIGDFIDLERATVREFKSTGLNRSGNHPEVLLSTRCLPMKFGHP